MRHSFEFHRELRGGRPVSFRPSRRRRRLPVGVALLAAIGIGGFVGLTWSVAERSASAPVVADAPAPASRRQAVESVRFGFCHTGGGVDCVVDGDTFRMAGTRIRIADIDAPETHPPRCAEEARLGAAATERLQALLNAGPVTLETAGRATDRYGRELRIVIRDGESLGEQLVAEGLARRWTGHRQPWC